MGALCTCQSEEELLKGMDAAQIAEYRNGLLTKANFKYFGKILSLSSPQPENSRRKWGSVRNDFTKTLKQLNLVNTFKIGQPNDYRNSEIESRMSHTASSVQLAGGRGNP